ncbi:hypothetical protein NC77_17940 [Janthinobacterium lividum]|uniref:phage tail tape measure protein n=1 Tax=Janthinobacterium lividum TaxID=29581 RepID=UPI0005368688|nr:phage tail tape measure C-terminal domain-containing protein [Janthinobacterium lividum]KHA77513.1 hypothetical protein NC77_17940 [Janthinobacterium lividum]
MAASGIGAIVISLGLDAADFIRNMAQQQRQAQSATERILGSFNSMAGGIAGALAAVGVALTFDAVVGELNKSIDALAKLDDMSQKTGASVENLSRLFKLAGARGQDFDAVDASLVKLAKGLNGVDEEGSNVKGALDALGLSTRNMKDQDPSVVLVDIAKKLQDYSDGAGKTALMVDLLGKSGANLLPYMNDVAESIDKFTGDSTEAAQAASKYQDELGNLGVKYDELVTKIVSDSLPAMGDFIQALDDTFKSANNLSGLQVSAFADDLAVGLARVVDVAILIPRIFSTIGGSFKAVWADIGVMQSALENLMPLGLAANAAQGKSGLAEFKKDLAERNKTVEESNKKLDDLWNIPANRMEQAVLNAIAGRNTGSENSVDAASNLLNGEGRTKKTLVYSPGGDKGKDTAAQEAKAQLAADLDRIKKQSEAIEAVYASAERIMEARRAAGLIDEADYFASKLGFLRLNSEQQEKALQDEIDRLGKENLTGKDRIDNARKVAAAEAALAKVRSTASFDAVINGVQEEAAAKKAARAYVEASKAAEAYIDTVNRQNSRELAGIGKGNDFRQEQAGRNQIEDKQTTQRQGLEGELRRGDIDQAQFDQYLAIVNDTYAKEIAAYGARNDAIKAKQAEWLNGADEAFANYQSNAENVAGNTAAMFTSAFDGMTEGVASSISKAILYGENLGESLKNVALNVADAFITSFIKIQIQKLFIDKTAAAGYAGTIAAQAQAMSAMAALNAFASTAAIPIVGPALAPAAGAAAFAVAEGFAAAATAAAAMSVASARGGFDIPAGVNPLTQLHEREMVLPARHADVIRNLSNNASNVGTGDMKLTLINNGTPQQVVESKRISADERLLIVQDAVRAVGAEFGDPNSPTSRSFRSNYSAERSRR